MTERPGGSRQTQQPASLPRPRPRWMVMLGMWMCLSAAWLLFSAVSSFQELRAGRPALPTAARDGEAVARAYRAMTDAYDREHPIALPLHAGGKLVLSLALLWAVATVISMDRRGRRAAVLAGLLSIVYFVGTAFFELLVVRAGVVAGAPALAEAMAKDAGPGAPSVEELTALAARFMVIVPIVTGALGVGFSVLLLVFFGGRRGRAYYGLPAARGDAG